MSAENTKSSKTKFSLFVIESRNFKDERENRLEGKILRDILRLSKQKVEYLYIRTRRELQVAMKRFHRSGRRYLHISCHGNSCAIGLSLEQLSFREFAGDIAPYMKNRRLFMSACAVVNKDLASLMLRQSGCYSVVGPRESIDFGDAALMWASFYHLMFRDPGSEAMKGGKIRWALRRARGAFGIEFNYFTSTRATGGFSQVNVDKR